MGDVGFEQRMALLLDVTGGLAEARTEDDVARTITSRGVIAFGAAFGGLWLLDRETGLLRLVAVSRLPRGGAERWLTVPLDIDAPMPECVRTGEPVYVDSHADYRARYAASWQRIQQTVTGEQSYAMVPLAENGPPIGALAITYDRANAIEPADRSVLRIVARQCALALRRIELHATERSARYDAEEATRAREEILSVVSRDLRDPLGTISMGVTTLQELVAPDDPNAERIRATVDCIRRESERMARQIEDLVDFAGIQAGKISIERRATRPQTIVAQTAERFGSIAGERGIGFSIDVADPMPMIDVDCERAVQVLSNLLANALKVTMKGGKVTIGAMGDAPVVFFVRDSGPGIEADELPRLFERYWRSKKATYKGAGLGLSIARGIVDAHDGRIWAESQVGVGATFYFTLTP